MILGSYGLRWRHRPFVRWAREPRGHGRLAVERSVYLDTSAFRCSKYVSAHASVRTSAHMSVHTSHSCLYKRPHSCLYTRPHSRVYTHIHTHVGTHVHTDACTHVLTRVYTHVYVLWRPCLCRRARGPRHSLLECSKA